MKATQRLMVCACLAVLCTFRVAGASPQTTAFTYQGQLKFAGVPVNGPHDFKFRLYESRTAVNRIPGSPELVFDNAPISRIIVTNGVFSKALDFGQNSFLGAEQWLEMEARRPGTAAYTKFPRELITAVPYALQLRGVSVTDAGNVGIGTDEPNSAKVVVNAGVAGEGLDLASSDSYANLRVIRNSLSSFDQDMFIGYESGTASSLHLYSDNNETLTVKAGNVGIGTPNPGSRLHVVSAAPGAQVPTIFAHSTSADGIAVFGRAAAGTLANWGVWGQSYSTSGVGVYGGNYATSGLTRGVVGETFSPEGYGGFFSGRGYFSGNVGIGTLNPGGSLHISSSGNDQIILSHPDTNGFPQILFQTPAGVNDSSISYDQANDLLYMANGGAARLTIDNSGKVSVPVLEIRGGADLAEPFDVGGESAEPGSVVVIDPDQPGKLKLSAKGYDRTVAGIISGAGGVQTGMVMGQQGSIADGTHHVALTGRVYCSCDASNGAIEPGDLLTTSATPGHAMKVTDHGQAQGAIIGKAMTGLSEGKGLVLVLVSLQ